MGPFFYGSQWVYLAPIFIVLAIWEGVWKGIALWRAARNGNLWWFIAIIVFNTVGILPIIYIIWFSKRQQKTTTTPTPPAPPATPA